MNNETFSNFNDVKHMPLRVYNRTVMFSNILKDFGQDQAQEYFNQFSKGEQRQLYLMQNYIRVNGVEKSKRAALEGFEPEGEDSYAVGGAIPAQ